MIGLRALAAASALPACVALTTAQPGGRALTEPAQTVADSAPFLLAEPRRSAQLQWRDLRLRVGLRDDLLCVQNRATRAERRWQAEVAFPRWAWLAAAGQLAGGLAGAWLLRDRPAAAAGVALAIGGDAAASVALMAGLYPLPPPLALPPLETRELPQLAVCGTDLPQGVTVEVAGGRGRAVEQTGPDGAAYFDAAQWPAVQFPYGEPIAAVQCAHCLPLPLFLPASAAAAWLVARGQLPDLQAWLRLHPADPETAAVAAARDRLHADLAAQQAAALQQARRYFAAHDWLAAAAAVRQCLQVRELANAACEQLAADIDARFTARQVSLCEEACARRDWPAAEQAHYRCLLVDRQGPACGRIAQTIAAARLAAARSDLVQALKNRELSSARRHLAVLEGLAGDEAAKVPLRAAVDALARDLGQRQADELAQRARKWLAKRKWARAQVLLEQCLATADAATARCAALWKKLPGRPPLPNE